MMYSLTWGKKDKKKGLLHLLLSDLGIPLFETGTRGHRRERQITDNLGPTSVATSV